MGFFQGIKNICSVWSWQRILNNISYLIRTDLKQQELEQTYRIKDEVLEECVYELEEYQKRLIRLQVLDSAQTIQLLSDHPMSFSRFGDGEIHIMQGMDQPFQNYDPQLAEKMLAILSGKRTDMYVGLNQAYFQSPLNFAERNRKFYRINGTRYRRFFADHCYPDRLYLDASCFGAYYRYPDGFDFEGHYARIKALFAGKKIAVVCGEGVFEKLKYNVFEEAADFMVVHGPRLHAFSQYSALMEKIEKTVPKDYLICLILGQTATVMVPDLTDMGYMTWDVGHIAKDYDAYKKQTAKTQANMDAFWAPD